jgi:membrane peptidoglycan carboxypeptidase
MEPEPPAEPAAAGSGEPTGPGPRSGLSWRRPPVLVAVVLLLVGVGAAAFGAGLRARPRVAAPARVSTVIYYADGQPMADLGKPWPDGVIGLVVPHVLSELSQQPPLKGWSWKEIANAGLKIYTTIQPKPQQLLERIADGRMPGSPMSLHADMTTAAVVVEPGTGRVLAYFSRGSEQADYAGTYLDEQGALVGSGMHPPGQTFQVYGLAGALGAGVSLQSRWQVGPRDMLGRTGARQVRDPSGCPNGASVCSLADASVNNINSIFYAVTLSITPRKVLEAARNAGITTMRDEHGEPVSLTATESSRLVPARFDTDLTLGGYAVSVMEQANAMATFAAQGRAAGAHFVLKVVSGTQAVYGEALPAPNSKALLTAGAMGDLDWMLSQTQAAGLKGDAPSAGMAGFAPAESANPTDGWMIGYTPQLGMAVWLGGGSSLDRSNNLAAQIYLEFMHSAPVNMGLPAAEPFPPRADVGNAFPDGAVAG